MNTVKSHAVWLGAAVAGLISFLMPSVNVWVAAHPQYSIVGATLVAIGAAFSKSPLTKS